MKIIKSEKLILDEYKQAYSASEIYNGDEFEIKKEDYDIGQVLLKQKKSVYRIATFKDLKADVIQFLEEGCDIPEIDIEIWIEAIGNLHTKTAFIESFVEILNNLEQLNSLDIALGLSNKNGDSPYIFWTCLNNILPEYLMYFKGIEAALEITNLESLADNITRIRIEEGHEQYNQIRDGIFISISSKEKPFYIFNVDPGIW